MDESIRYVLRQQLLEKGTAPVDIDAGSAGKTFEATLLKAFDLVGLQYDKNRTTGSVWDIRPKGSGWDRLVTGKDVNIKVAKALWLFGSAAFSKILPWNEIDDVESFDTVKAAKRVKRIINKHGIPKVVFLKPATPEVQQNIIAATKSKDVEKLNDLLTKKNFKSSSIGTNYEVRVSVRDNRIGSIAIVKGGKVFGRSERPRMVKGSSLVGFRSPRDAQKRLKPTRVKSESRDSNHTYEHTCRSIQRSSYTRSTGKIYAGEAIRSFFDGEGNLRFSSLDDVLIDPLSDERLLQLIEVADSLDVDNQLFDVFDSFIGDLDELYNEVTKRYALT